MNNKVLIIVGPTAVGKTEYAINIATHFQGEIISADSMQVYKYMDIGSAKPSPAQLSKVKHHLVDSVDPLSPWTVADYQHHAKLIIKDIQERGLLPVISGGTGLYINSLLFDMNFSAMPQQSCIRRQLEAEAKLKGSQVLHEKLRSLDPKTASRIHPNNAKKIIRAIEVLKVSGKSIPDFSESYRKTTDYDWILIGLIRDRAVLYERINQRVKALIDAGLIEEVRKLQEMGLSEEDTSMKGIGYKEVLSFLNGEYNLDEAIRLIQRNTRRYAKRQITWFKRYQDIRWFNLTELKDNALKEIISYVQDKLLD